MIVLPDAAAILWFEAFHAALVPMKVWSVTLWAWRKEGVSERSSKLRTYCARTGFDDLSAGLAEEQLISLTWRWMPAFPSSFRTRMASVLSFLESR